MDGEVKNPKKKITQVEVVPEDAGRAINRHFEAFERLAGDFPGLVGVMMAIGHQLVNYSNSKKIKPSEIEFDNPRWHNDGTIVIKVKHKGRFLGPKEVRL